MSQLTQVSDSTPAQVPLKLYRNTHQARVFTFFDVVNGVETPIDLAARYSDFRIDVRRKDAPQSELMIRKVLGDGIAISLTNKLIVKWNPEDTEPLEAGVYFFDLFAIEDTETKALLRGRWELVNNVTNINEVES